jgi:DNA invertase Pin-like site-specific DNA recombinase
MLKFVFDPRKPHWVVVYLRMSSDKQNKRSPDQQLAEIRMRLRKLGFNWKIIKVFRDDAISGRYYRRRVRFQQMLEEIRSGRIAPRMILVDTLERLGRLEDIHMIRKELFEKFGVLVLTADTDFSDPTTPQGRVHGVVESLRASEDGRLKAHQVMRGKRDLAERKFWPGGPAPFGFRLESVLGEVNGRSEVLGSVLKPDPQTQWIVVLLFETALAQRWGQTRLARFLNEHPKIPDACKPFYPPTVADMIRNTLYMGLFQFNIVCTGVIDDTRVQRANEASDVTIVPEFCIPIVAPELFRAVNDLFDARSAKAASAKLPDSDQAPTGAWAPGMSLNFPLSGLVRCGHCGRAMTVSSSPTYTTKEGVSRRYSSYVCPGYVARVCPNGRRIPEDWLRATVLAALRARLELES